MSSLVLGVLRPKVLRYRSHHWIPDGFTTSIRKNGNPFSASVNYNHYDDRSVLAFGSRLPEPITCDSRMS